MKKRTLATLLLVCFLIALLPGCGGGNQEASAPADETVNTTATPAEPTSDYLNTNDRPIAVMIDNDGKDSWPHSGLQDAYLIYEMYVEGSSTRLMALFKGTNTEKIGPVRSCRHYFLDYALENDAIYVAYGWSPRGQSDSHSMGADFINGIQGIDESYFWRERKYKGDYHSAYTSIEKIKTAAEKKGYRTTTDVKFQDYNAEITPMETGDSATSFKIPYAGHYTVTYTYDADKHSYTRTLNSSILHQNADGVPFTPTNIIIMEVKNYGLGDADNPARQQFDTVGSGKGYFITEGKKIDITWQKDSRTAKTIYKDMNGNSLKLNPGMTFINLVKPGTAINFE